MELDITKFTMTKHPMDYQASMAEIGCNAARETWQAALECDIIFVTDANRKAFVDHFAGYGAWPKKELNAWPKKELNALVIQEISSQIREFSDEPISEWDWDDYQLQSEIGSIMGLLFKTNDRIYCCFDV